MGAGDGAIFTRHTAEIDSYTVPYLRGGAQRALDPALFLHGFGGGGKWESLHMAMGTVTLTLAPALPGWSQGEAPAGIDSVRDYADLALQLLDALDLPHVILVGHSAGGWVAQYLATEQPKRVSRLVLIDAMGLDVPDAPAADLGTLDEEAFATRAFGKLGLVATANPYGFGAEWQAVRQGPEFERQWKGSRLLARLAKGAYGDPALTNAMGNVQVDTLLLWGKLDGIVPLRHGEVLHQAIPGSSLRVIDRAGHLPMYERPETVNRLVRDFLIGVQEEIPDVVAL